MIEDATLLEDKGKELKRQLEIDEYKTLTDVMLDGTGRLIQKPSQSQEPVPFWVSAVVVALITLLIGFLTSLVFGEFDPSRRKDVTMGLAIVVFALVSMVLSKIAESILLVTLRDHLLNAIELAACRRNSCECG